MGIICRYRHRHESVVGDRRRSSPSPSDGIWILLAFIFSFRFSLAIFSIVLAFAFTLPRDIDRAPYGFFDDLQVDSLSANDFTKVTPKNAMLLFEDLLLWCCLWCGRMLPRDLICAGIPEIEIAFVRHSHPTCRQRRPRRWPWRRRHRHLNRSDFGRVYYCCGDSSTWRWHPCFRRRVLFFNLSGLVAVHLNDNSILIYPHR
mmetsp:Transcript_40831/g.64750  ORF Transcript_40831/g.64750 Transcript_40831/m.64750 type:complete len:202 (-) Transcript_40831:1243-1848(-)